MKTVNLPDETWKRAKVAAIERQQSLQDFVDDAVQAALDRAGSTLDARGPMLEGGVGKVTIEPRKKR